MVQSVLIQPLGATWMQHDLANIAGCAPLIDAVRSVICFVANAVVPPRRDVLTITSEDFDFFSGINLRDPFFLAQSITEQMQ